MSAIVSGTHLGLPRSVRTLVMVSLLAGCAADSDNIAECKCITYEVTSASPFDRLVVMVTTPQSASGPAPRTPAMLAEDTPAPASFDLDWVLTAADRTYDPPVRSEFYDHSDIYGYDALLAVGFDQGAIVGVDYTSLDYVHEYESYYVAEGTLELESAPTIEAWGAQICVRIATPTFTRYLLHAGDRDCDAIPDAEDCKPNDYCDPAATSPAGIAACQCPV